MAEWIRSIVRPTITIIFTIGVWGACYLDKVDIQPLLAMYGPILGFWFGERSARKNGG